MTSVSSKSPAKSNETGYVAGFLKWLPVIQWVLTIAFGIGLFIVSQRDSATVQASRIEETSRKVAVIESTIEKKSENRDRQFEQLRRDMLPREVYEAYHKNDVEQMNRIEKMLEQNMLNANRYFDK